MAPKQTRLDDSAEIYKRRGQVSEREKIKELDFAGKVEYFKNYYLAKLIVILLVVALVTWLLVTMFGPKKDKVLNLVFVNYPISQEDIDIIQTDLSEILQLDANKQEITFDTGYDLKNDDYASIEKLATYVFAGAVDIFIAPESEFINYAVANTMYPLTDLFPTDLYSTLNQNELLICKTRMSEDETLVNATGPEGVFGIYIQDLPMFRSFKPEYVESDPPVLGVIASCKNRDNAIELIRYFLGQKKPQ